MKKVKGIINLIRKQIGWDLEIEHKGSIIRECLQQWHKTEEAESIELEFEIKSVFQFKTTSQLGYLHAEVYKRWIDYVKESGVEDTQEKIISDLKTAFGFIDEKKNVITGRKETVIKSLSKASKEEVSGWIDRLIREGSELGIIFETPEDYKKRKGIKEFSK